MQSDTTKPPEWQFTDVRAENGEQTGPAVCFHVAKGWPMAYLSVAKAERLVHDLTEAIRRARNADFGRPVESA